MQKILHMTLRKLCKRLKMKCPDIYESNNVDRNNYIFLYSYCINFFKNNLNIYIYLSGTFSPNRQVTEYLHYYIRTNRT